MTIEKYLSTTWIAFYGLYGEQVKCPGSGGHHRTKGLFLQLDNGITMPLCGCCQVAPAIAQMGSLPTHETHVLHVEQISFSIQLKHTYIYYTKACKLNLNGYHILLSHYYANITEKVFASMSQLWYVYDQCV